MPLRDESSGAESYGGGRYALDTSKGADLGGDFDHLVVDLNFFATRPADTTIAGCAPAPPSSTISAVISAGERL